MVIFGPKPRVNPFGKVSIFRLFELPSFFSTLRANRVQGHPIHTEGTGYHP